VALTTHNRVSGRGVEVLNVYRDGPAWNAGVRRGDIFLDVDGVDVSNFTTSDIVDLVRGPRGTPVTITFQRPGEGEPVVLEIVRGTIELIEVSTTMIDSVGYLSLRTFGNQRVHEQLVEGLAKLRDQGATALVLDLRDNGGGLLTQGILVADEFLSRGDIVFQRARGVTQRLATADMAGLLTDLPMVVLVNNQSASASEIVAGALQDNGRALVVGERTFGKGVAQSVISLADGGQLAYMSFEWLTPHRRSINAEGIVPDVEVRDSRFPQTITVEGRGPEAGQTVEILVDGVSVGSATVSDDGTFKFLTVGPRPPMSEVQGEALVDPENDAILAKGLEMLRLGFATTGQR
jgi:carboxyl-terminal processing protease